MFNKHYNFVRHRFTSSNSKLAKIIPTRSSWLLRLPWFAIDGRNLKAVDFFDGQITTKMNQQINIEEEKI